MRAWSLYAKLALGLVVLLAAVGLLYFFLSTSATEHYLQEVNQRFNRDLARNLVADRNLVTEGRIDQQALEDTFHQYMVINPSIEIYLLDVNGHILSYSADPGKVKRRSVSLAPIHEFLRNPDRLVLGDDPRSHDGLKAFSVTPVPSAEVMQGYLYVVLRGQEIEALEQAIRDSHLLHLSGWAVAISLAAGLIVGLVVFRLLTRRLQRLATVMDRFDASGFEVHQAYTEGGGKAAHGDEIDRLGATFDRMAERIGAQLERLKEQDSLRRELVAHISHDLRTPLTGLHGYLESLAVKGASLSETERADYLATALRQSERLGALVAALFDLSRLEARDTAPQLEPFPPAELVQDVLQRFRLHSEEKAIELTLEPAPDLPWVWADVALTERVLENLIGNALSHTRRQGRVHLSLQQQGDKVQVRVSDNGIGIPAHRLPHIFDPFYSTSRRRSSAHAGLGLAIAKRIVELQQGELTVSSALGKGTSFCFTLPVHRA